jgi:hypothetical protein
MMNEEQIYNQINQQMSQFNGTPSPWHVHNGGADDSPQLDPNVSLTGFPVVYVSDASVAPTDLYQNGKFRFQVDFKAGVAHFYLWVYLVYINASNQQISSWRYVALT